MSDLITSLARTYAAKIVGALVGLALVASVVVPAELSDQTTAALAAALVLGAQMIYYVAVRLVEQRWPGAGRLLLLPRRPTYDDPRPSYTVSAARPHVGRDRPDDW